MAKDYKVSEARLKNLLEAELILTALENEDVEKWRKYKKALSNYQKIWAAHYLSAGEKPIPYPAMAKKALKNYSVVK